MCRLLFRVNICAWRLFFPVLRLYYFLFFRRGSRKAGARPGVPAPGLASTAFKPGPTGQKAFRESVHTCPSIDSLVGDLAKRPPGGSGIAGPSKACRLRGGGTLRAFDTGRVTASQHSRHRATLSSAWAPPSVAYSGTGRASSTETGTRNKNDSVTVSRASCSQSRIDVSNAKRN